jgi:hypothetical protein
MTATVREGGNDSRQVQRCTQINDVPALPVPNQLSLDEGSTNRKVKFRIPNFFKYLLTSYIHNSRIKCCETVLQSFPVLHLSVVFISPDLVHTV